MTMREQIEKLVERMRHNVKHPMKTWSAGEVIAADKVDDWADELSALAASLPAPDAGLREAASEGTSKYTWPCRICGVEHTAYIPFDFTGDDLKQARAAAHREQEGKK